MHMPLTYILFELFEGIGLTLMKRSHLETL